MKIYKLLGYLLLGIGAYAFLNANNTDLYAQRYPLGQANSAVTQEQTTYKRNRHTITLVLNQLSDLKVEEGQRINVGDIISDKPTAWLRYALPKEPSYKPRSKG